MELSSSERLRGRIPICHDAKRGPFPPWSPARFLFSFFFFFLIFFSQWDCAAALLSHKRATDNVKGQLWEWKGLKMGIKVKSRQKKKKQADECLVDSFQEMQAHFVDNKNTRKWRYDDAINSLFLSGEKKQL